MKNKELINLTLIFLLISILGYLGTVFIHQLILNLVVNVFYFLFQFFGIILLVKNGTTLNTIYFKIISFFIGIVILSILFRVMHWAGGNILFVSSLIGIFIIYFFRFYSKKQKKYADFLKVLCVTTFVILTNLIFLHIIKKEFGLISQLFFCILLLDFIIKDFRLKKSNSSL